MKTKSAFTFFFMLMVLLNSANAQLVIDANSGFWDNSPVGKEFMISINNPGEYSFTYNAEEKSYEGEKILEVAGKPYWKFVVVFDLWINEGDEVRYLSPYEPGDLDRGHSNYNQAKSDYEYNDDVIDIFIDKDHAILFSTSLEYTDDADVEAMGLGYDEEQILHGKTAKQAHQDLIKYLRKNLKVKKIGDASDNQSVTNDQNVTDVQNDSENEESLDNSETTNPFEQDSSKDWVVVVGGAAALAVAMTLVAKIFKARRKKSAGKPNQPEPKKSNKQQKEKKKKEEEEEEEKFFYILQLNKDMLEIGPEKSDKLVITAWRVDSAGNRSLAQDAAIQVQTSEKGIAISSPSGNGQCASEISLKSQGQLEDALLNITAAVGGKTLKATAKVTCIQQLTLIIDAPTPLTFINGKKYQEALFEQQKGETDGEWVFKPFCLWFTDDPNPTIDPDRTKPVKPPFTPIFKIEAMPDILEISTPVIHGENVWKADVKLFAEKSVDTNWLFNDGKIKITVTVDEQKLNVK
jgi:hypothetical protein